MDLLTLKNIPILDIADKLGIDVKKRKSRCINPNHEDRNPSMNFDIRQNLFKCFSCGIGGDNIKLVEHALKIDFKRSLDWFESNYPINSKKDQGWQYRGHTSQAKRTTTEPSQFSIVRAQKSNPQPLKKGGSYSDIYRFFIDNLQGQEAVTYLASRGISREISIHFLIKTIPKDRDSQNKIISALIGKYGLEHSRESGIIAISKNDNPYLWLWGNRLVIPYFDIKGNIINIQGRDIDNHGKSKYRLLNGIETTLYNLPALEHEHIAIVEGVVDCLSVYQLREWDNIGQPIGVAGTNGWKDSYYDLLDGKNITIATDNDRSGLLFRDKMIKELSERYFKLPKWVDFSNYLYNDINEILTMGATT